jgi:hypothetical protein
VVPVSCADRAEQSVRTEAAPTEVVASYRTTPFEVVGRCVVSWDVSNGLARAARTAQLRSGCGAYRTGLPGRCELELLHG